MAHFDAASTGSQNSGTSITVSHTVATGVGRLLVVALHYRAHNTPAAHATAVTYNGVDLEFIRREYATDRATELWYLFDPDIGTHDVVVTMSADPENMVAGAVSYLDMDSSLGLIRSDGAVDENALGAGHPDVQTITESTDNPLQLIIAALNIYPNGGDNDPTAIYGTNRYGVNSPVPNVGGHLADSDGAVGPTEIRWESDQQFSWSIAAAIFATSPAERYLVEVDWDGDGDFADSEEDISADATSATTRRGREWESNLFGRSIAGSCSIELNNESGKYSSLNADSPIAGNVIPGRKVRISMLAPFDGVLFTGYLTALNPKAGSLPTATLEAAGAFSFLASKTNKISPQPLDNVLTGVAVNAILDAARWPPAATQFVSNGSFETGGAPGTGWTNDAVGLTGTWTMNADKPTGGGAQSLQLVASGGTPGYKIAYQTIPVPFLAMRAATLKLDYAYRVVSYAGATLDAWISLNYFDQGGAVIASHDVVVDHTAGAWIQGSVNLNAPEGTASINLFVGIKGTYDSNLTARFDLLALSWPEGLGRGTRSVDAGEVPIGRWALDNAGALAALQEMEETEIGFLYEGLNFDVRFDSRFARATDHPTAVASFSDAVGERLQYEDVEQADPLAEIYNIMTAVVQPAHAGSAGTVLWTQRETPISLPAGESVTYKATIPSGDLYASLWVTPVVGTDVTQTGVSNSDIAISAVKKGAKSMRFTVTNNHGSTTASLTLVQARGTPMITDEPIGIESHDQTSIDTYGPREFPLPSSFYYNTAYAQSSADYFISQFKDPRPILKVTLPAGHIPEVMARAVSLDINERIAFAAQGPKTKLGIAQDFFIESIEHRIQAGAPLQTIWNLSPAGNSTYWVLGTSELGTDTILAW